MAAEKRKRRGRAVRDGMIVPTVRPADYIASWLDVLYAIIRAASAASKAADYLFGRAIRRWPPASRRSGRCWANQAGRPSMCWCKPAKAGSTSATPGDPGWLVAAQSGTGLGLSIVPPRRAVHSHHRPPARPLRRCSPSGVAESVPADIGDTLKRAGLPAHPAPPSAAVKLPKPFP